MSFERAQAIADQLLFEGTTLGLRWPPGTLAPHAWSGRGGSAPWWMEAQCLVEGTAETEIKGRLRFLQATAQVVEDGLGRRVEADPLLVSSQDGELREFDFGFHLGDVLSEVIVPFSGPAASDVESLSSSQIVRTKHAVLGGIHLEAAALEEPLFRLRVRVENRTPWDVPGARREEVLRASALTCHVILRAESGAFISLLDPPTWAEAAARTCRSVGWFPVLAGAPGERDVVLASPVVLVDYPNDARR